MAGNRVVDAVALAMCMVVAAWSWGAERKAPTSRPTSRPVAGTPEARVEAAKNDLSSLSLALDMYEIDTGRYPTTEEGLGALVEMPKNTRDWHGPYIKRMPKDPWGNAYVYVSPGKHNTRGFDVSSMGPDGKAGTNDDIGNWRP